MLDGPLALLSARHGPKPVTRPSPEPSGCREEAAWGTPRPTGTTRLACARAALETAAVLGSLSPLPVAGPVLHGFPGEPSDSVFFLLPKDHIGIRSHCHPGMGAPLPVSLDFTALTPTC